MQFHDLGISEVIKGIPHELFLVSWNTVPLVYEAVSIVLS